MAALAACRSRGKPAKLAKTRPYGIPEGRESGQTNRHVLLRNPVRARSDQKRTLKEVIRAPVSQKPSTKTQAKQELTAKHAWRWHVDQRPAPTQAAPAHVQPNSAQLPVPRQTLPAAREQDTYGRPPSLRQVRAVSARHRENSARIRAGSMSAQCAWTQATTSENEMSPSLSQNRCQAISIARASRTRSMIKLQQESGP